MTLPAGPYLPNSALVAIAWLSQRVPGLSGAMVAASLPRDTTKWADNGFAQVTIIPGSFEVDSGGRRRATAQVDAWGFYPATDGSAQPRPAVNKAARIAELIVRACEEDVQVFGRPVALPADYLPARVLSAYPLTDPAPVLNDPSGYGRVTLDLALDWVRL